MTGSARGLAWLSALLLLLGACRTAPLTGRVAPPPAASVAVPPTPQGAASAPAAPPQETGLSVEEALVLALRNNRDLRVQQYEPVITGAFEAIEMGVFDPEVFAEVTARHERALEVSRSTQEQFGVDGTEAEARIGARRRFPSGTDVEIGLGYETEESNRSPTQGRVRFGATITQNLLRGRGAAVNLAGVRRARAATSVSRYELRGFIEILLADTKVAYWDLVLAMEETRIVERSLEIAEQQLREIEQSIEVGTLSPAEAAAARTEVALRDQALINVRSRIEERRLRLLKLIGPPSDGGFLREIEPTTSPGRPEPPLDDVEDRVTLALRSRPDLNEARARHREASLETIMTRDGLRPRLDFFLALGKTGYSDDLIGSFREFGDDTYDLTAGLSYSHKPVDRAARGRNLQAWAQRHQAAAAIRNLEAVVRFDVLLAANEVERTRQLIRASTTTRSLQEEVVQAERERFLVGASTAILVAQAQRDLLAAEIAEVEAGVNYRIALVRLYLAEGTMLERHGITAP